MTLDTSDTNTRDITMVDYGGGFGSCRKSNYSGDKKPHDRMLRS